MKRYRGPPDSFDGWRELSGSGWGGACPWGATCLNTIGFVVLRKGKAVFPTPRPPNAPAGEALRPSLRPLFRAVKHHRRKQKKCKHASSPPVALSQHSTPSGISRRHGDRAARQGRLDVGPGLFDLDCPNAQRQHSKRKTPKPKPKMASRTSPCINDQPARTKHMLPTKSNNFANVIMNPT